MANLKQGTCVVLRMEACDTSPCTAAPGGSVCHGKKEFENVGFVVESERARFELPDLLEKDGLSLLISRAVSYSQRTLCYRISAQ
jgi:hypothetical protein